MPSGSLLALLDDIATILDDVSVMTKTAATKTAGVLGDDLALNAEQVTGVVAKREIPVVWAVAKGSFLNKLILVPAALLISAFAPFLVIPLLMIGGLYLSFEGAEKILHLIHKRAHPTREEAAQKLKMLAAGSVEEKAKIKGAIRTDFILSAEIIAITLGIVAAKPFIIQLLTLSTIAIGITVIVYGLVAGIVKLDDLGLHLVQRPGSFAQKTGRAILWTAPYLMKFLSIAGTVAMFLVGGGIIVHGIPWLHHQIEHLAHGAGSVSALFIPTLLNGLVGLVVGFLAVGIYKLFAKKQAH